MRTKVINLVGASGSGKTSIAKELEQQGYNVIQSYTTRAARSYNEWGHTFIKGKLSDNGKDIISGCGVFERGSMIAYFNSYNSGNHYFATDEQVLRGKTNIYIVDPKGAEMVHRFYEGTDIKVVTIYLNVDESVRAKRLLVRMEDTSFSCMFEDNPKECPEVWGRIRQDRKIFSIAKCDYSIDANGSIDEVTDKVKKVILKQQQSINYLLFGYMSDKEEIEMEKWKDIARAIKEIDRAAVRLSQPILKVGIKKNDPIYKDYKGFLEISSKLRSDLEEEMLNQHPDISDEEFRIMFYGYEKEEE